MHASGSLVSQKSNPTADNIQTAEQTKVATQMASRVPLVLATLYFAVAIALVVRLLVGLALTHRLIGLAREIHLVAPLGLPRRRSLRMLETCSVHVPATVGFLHPVVLLPMSWREWSDSKLQAVLAHELAHVRRADWLVITLAELNRALYWLHPVAWIIKRRLSELAEQNCDDAVLEADGNRTLYAGYLLEVAASLTNAGSRYQPPRHGIAMARKPNVETRIDAILDASRPLARRLGALGVITLFACGASAILVAAALRTSAEDTPRQSAAEMKMKAAAASDGAKSDKPADKTGTPVPKQLHVKGRVLGPDGKPVAGATVFAAWSLLRGDPLSGIIKSGRIEHRIIAETKSDAQGTFDLEVSTQPPDVTRMSEGWQITAFAPGFGPVWRRDVFLFKDASAKATTTLSLTSDQPIRGRVVDLEGSPLAGIHVRIHELVSPESELALLDWIQEAKGKSPPRTVDDYFEPSLASGGTGKNSPYASAFPVHWNDGKLSHGGPALPADCETDKDGRFEFRQLGVDRLATLEFDGPSIARCLAHVVTRDMEPVSAKPPERFGVRTGTYYGRDFQFVAEPTQPIIGTVTDADTREPLANLEVHVSQLAGDTMSQNDFLATHTDENGHYQLIGAPRGGGHEIEVDLSPDRPYFPTEKKLAKASGFDPITCDFALHRGQWIVGRVTDRQSGAPIKNAVVEYLPLRSNKHAQDYPNYDPQISGHTPSNRYRTSNDGSFRVLAIPGAGILAAIATGEDEHTYSSLSEDLVPKHLVQTKGSSGRGSLNTYHPWVVTGYHALREVDLAKPNKDATYDLELTRGLSRFVKLVDTQGQTVKAVRVLGRCFPPNFEQPLRESAVEIIGLRPIEARDVVFIQPERRIGKALKIAAGDETTIELEPCAVVHGRVLDEEGQPVRGLNVNVTLEQRPDNWNRPVIGTTTGEDGRFEALLPPGATFRIWHYSKNAPNFSAECRSMPGAVFELGDLTNGAKLTADHTEKLMTTKKADAANKADNPRAEETPMPATSDAKRTTIHGRISGVDGKPAADVDVAVIGSRKGTERGGDLAPLGVVLAERRTDSDGRYRIELDGISSKTHRYVNLIARTNGTALAWRKLNLNADVDESFRLQSEEMISGRLVDIEGQPAAGVNLHVSAIVARIADKARWPTEGVGLDGNFRPSRWPLAWPEPIVTDGEGRFAIHGVPREHGVNLEVEGGERFAPQTIVLNSGMAEQRGERDATYRSLIKNLKPGEEAVLPLSPAQLFTGTVRYEDTGEPAPLARLTVWSSQEKFGSSFGLPGTADEKGRYKISAHPGIRFGVIAYPPDAVPYLAREKNDISWEDGARSKVLDIVLPRGVLIQGKVLEDGSDSPIAGAAVQYHAEEAHNPRHSDNIVTGWRDIHLADKEGRFSIVVLPGPGRLLAHGPGDSYVLQETSEQELYKGTPGGRRHYAHVIEKISPEPNVARPEIVIRLKRGATVRGELVDQQGIAVDRSEIFSRLHIDPGSLSWRGSGVEATGGRFELSGLAPNKDYPVNFLDAKRRLGATLIAKAGMPSPRIVLAPCGAAEMRFVDDKGKPVAKYEPFIQLVVTPGEQEYSEAMMKGDTLAADAESIWVVDPVNHPFIPDATDDEGRFKASALIPGATYRVATFSKHRFILSKEFNAVASQTINLGDVVVERRE